MSNSCSKNAKTVGRIRRCCVVVMLQLPTGEMVTISR